MYVSVHVQSTVWAFLVWVEENCCSVPTMQFSLFFDSIATHTYNTYVQKLCATLLTQYHIQFHPIFVFFFFHLFLLFFCFLFKMLGFCAQTAHIIQAAHIKAKKNIF